MLFQFFFAQMTKSNKNIIGSLVWPGDVIVTGPRCRADLPPKGENAVYVAGHAIAAASLVTGRNERQVSSVRALLKRRRLRRRIILSLLLVPVREFHLLGGFVH